MGNVCTVVKGKDGRTMSIKKETTTSNINRYLSNSDTQTEIQRSIYNKLSEMNVNNLLALQTILLKLDANNMQLYDLLSILNNKIDRYYYESQTKINAIDNKLNELRNKQAYTPNCSKCPANMLYSSLKFNRCM